MVLGTPSPYKPPSSLADSRQDSWPTLAAAREDLESPLRDRLALRKAIDAEEAAKASPIKPPLLSDRASSARMEQSKLEEALGGVGGTSKARAPRVFARSPSGKAAPPSATAEPPPLEPTYSKLLAEEVEELEWENAAMEAKLKLADRPSFRAAPSTPPTAAAADGRSGEGTTPLSAKNRSRQLELSKKLFPSQPVLVRTGTAAKSRMQAEAEAAVGAASFPEPPQAAPKTKGAPARAAPKGKGGDASGNGFFDFDSTECCWARGK